MWSGALYIAIAKELQSGRPSDAAVTLRHVLGRRLKTDDALALLSYTERSATPVEATYGELRATVARLRAGLEADGVRAGDATTRSAAIVSRRRPRRCPRRARGSGVCA